MKDLKIRGETSNLIVFIADEEALEGRNLCCSSGTHRTADSPTVGHFLCPAKLHWILSFNGFIVI